MAKQKVELDNMKHTNSDLRAENTNLNKENEKLKDKIERLKEKNKQESARLLKANIETEELIKVAPEELEEVQIFNF